MSKNPLLLLFFLLPFLSLLRGQQPLAIGYFLNETIKTDAYCLDGSGPLYYYLPGVDSGANKWYLHFEGGGWCTSTEDCFNRSQTNLGSTLQDPPLKSINWDYFSNNISDNPLLYNWNKIYMRYCDGGSFSGDNLGYYEENLLYFKGKMIRNEIVKDLLMNRGMGMATDVIVSGASAGALASILHGDYIREMVGEGKKVVVMPDSGFFLDFVGIGVDYHSQMRWVFENMNSRAGVNQKCINYYGKDSWRCFFAEYALPFVESPVFALQPKFDSWQMDNVLGVRNETLVNSFGKEVMKRLTVAFLRFDKNSGFIDSCSHHCGLWNIIHINNVTQSQAFYLWYNGIERNAYIRDETFICNECCN